MKRMAKFLIKMVYYGIRSVNGNCVLQCHCGFNFPPLSRKIEIDTLFLSQVVFSLYFCPYIDVSVVCPVTKVKTLTGGSKLMQ